MLALLASTSGVLAGCFSSESIADIDVANMTEKDVEFSITVTRLSDNTVVLEDTDTIRPFDSEEEPITKRYQDPMKTDGEYGIQVTADNGVAGENVYDSCGGNDACGQFIEIRSNEVAFSETVA